MPQPQQKQRQRKITEYGQQLQEKQKVRRSYGMREAQFRRYFNTALKFRGQTGEMLLKGLESRIDNVLFRAGLAKTRPQARQLISHRHFSLNGKRITIASLQVKPGDVIKPVKKEEITLNQEIQKAEWLKVDPKTLAITVVRLPETTDLPIEFDTQKIIEFYSR